MENFAIIVNTHSSYADIWPMFFGQLEKFISDIKVYVFTDKNSILFDKHNVIFYNPNDDFRTQYLTCLKQVKEKICLNLNDDYILYDKINLDEILELISILDADNNISQIRFVRGPNYTNKFYNENLFFLDINQEYWYSQTASLWKRDILVKIHELSPPSGIARKNNQLQLEVLANKICKKLNLIGLCYFSNTEKKVGQNHYECKIMPHICSAIVGGKWNISEYKEIMPKLLSFYNVDISERDVC